METRNYPPERYMAARMFLERLRPYRRVMPSRAYNEIKAMALSGDIDGAEMALARSTRRDAACEPIRRG